MTDLLEPFRFSVFHPRDLTARLVLETQGVCRLSKGSVGNFEMWVDLPPDALDPPHPRIMLSYEHDLLLFPAKTSKQREELGRRIASVFCTFVQGGLLGWSVIRSRGADDNDHVSDVLVDEYVELGKGYDFVALGLRKDQVVRMCREDITSYGLARYATGGAQDAWEPERFMASGFGRIPYPRDTVYQVVDTFLAEGVFRGQMGDGWSDAFVAIAPQKYREDWADHPAEGAERWLRRLHAIGGDRNWSSRENEPHTAAASESIPDREPRPPRVFIIHGHDEAKRRELVDILTRRFGLEVVVMQERAGRSRTFIEKFEQEAVPCNAAIAVLTPDDVVTRVSESYAQPRPNVIY